MFRGGGDVVNFSRNRLVSRRFESGDLGRVIAIRKNRGSAFADFCEVYAPEPSVFGRGWLVIGFRTSCNCNTEAV